MRWRPRANHIVAVLLVCAAVSGAVGSVQAATAFFQKDFSEMGHVPNLSAPQKGICAAAADINSFIYLLNHFPQVYGGTNLLPDWDGDGVLTQSDYLASRDKLANGWEHNGTSRLGMYGGGNTGTANAIWEHTLYWFEDFAPGTTVFDGQVNTTLNVLGWHGGQVLEQSYPTWSFLWNSLAAAVDIELGLLPTSGGIGHALTFTGLAFNDLDADGRWDANEAVEQVGFVDPNKPDQMTWANVSTGTGGRIQFPWGPEQKTYYVYRAYTEGPISVPEPAAAVSLFALLLFGSFWIRRRKS
jgi:hypothetical protein